MSLYGQPADFPAINAIADRHGLAVIEDGAQSFGSEQQGRRSCGLSTIGTTSFSPSKPFGGYGDGGACFTDDPELADRMRRVSRHGQAKRYFHTDIGVNGRIDTLQAAILLGKWPNFAKEVEARGRIGAAYSRKLQALESPPRHSWLQAIPAYTPNTPCRWIIGPRCRLNSKIRDSPRLSTTPRCFASNQLCVAITASAAVVATHPSLKQPVSG